MLTLEKLRNTLDYDPNTGNFYTKDGKLRGSKTWRGYIHIKIDGERFTGHRLAWLYVKGKWPDKEIDHINGDPSDNRLANLRDVDHLTNMNNTTKYMNNTSGIPGVTWDKKAGKWRAQTQVNGTKMFLGLFVEQDEAKDAVRRAKNKEAINAELPSEMQMPVVEPADCLSCNGKGHRDYFGVLKDCPQCNGTGKT